MKLPNPKPVSIEVDVSADPSKAYSDEGSTKLLNKMLTTGPS